MSERSNSALTGATTYQAIVIALVAAGIISIGILSVCYRRRRREQWEQTVRAGLDRARYRHGFGGSPNGDGAGDGVDLGDKPVLFDVGIDGEKEDWMPIRLGMDGENETPGQPISTPDVELTILIAMPHSPYQYDQLDPSSSTSSLTSVDLKKPELHTDPFTLSSLPHYRSTGTGVEDEELPHLELGTTCVPVHIVSAEDREEIQEMRLGTMSSRAEIAGDWGRTDTTPG